ncbi:3'-5' exonuclease [Shewanella gelidii]|uniref:DNA-directed DNA polymerase n=1 Tax=Shewanella gelidii TaxID=1642821 RepID=A0A917NCD0_9GAMM|nr:3'-5' exonuclease [Shewanella gelidii]MCL1098742.1 3'-5' exonuclease [Shewanella gelidii]GGI87974.1 DNA polymerase III subunit epsilon [Shewanella gelidii]
MSDPANSVVVLDFETTGLSPTMGDRAIEVGAVRIEQGEITGSFQQLMNPGFAINSFIEEYTGIRNGMLAHAPSCEEVMDQFADFIGDANLIAHNASFDQRFLDAELDVIGRGYGGEFACSMLIARRLYPDAPNHKLASLVSYKSIANDGVFHRALADAQVTAQLWLTMLNDLATEYQVKQPTFAMMQKLSRTPKAKLHRFLQAQI